MNRVSNSSNGRNKKNRNTNAEDIKKQSRKKVVTKKEVKNKEVSQYKKEQKGKKILQQEKINKKEAKRKKGPIRRFFKRFFILLFIAIIIIGILFYKKTEENGGGVKGALITLFGQSLEEIENLETINVLVLGISEDLDSKLTDTIMVCSYNPQNQMASMLSIPRDTFIGKNKNTAKGSQKINALYSKGVEKTIEAVSDITGINIEHYVVVNNDTLIKIVDIIGGVKFNVPIDMDYDDETQNLHIHLKKGMQTIDGKKAEQLLRFRHNNDYTSYPAEYGDNDYGRMKTQRDFMTETIKQTLDICNLIKAKEIIDTVFDNIETDLEMDELLPYVPTAVDFSTDNINSMQLPGVSDKYNEIWFFIHDKEKTKTVVNELKTKIEN